MSKRTPCCFIALALLLLAMSMVACRGGSPPCQLHSQYKVVTDDAEEAELTFTPNGKDHFIVRETGLKTFMGVGTFIEGVLRVIFQSANGYSGTFTWDLDPTCTTGKGHLVLETGGSGTHASTLTAVP